MFWYLVICMLMLYPFAIVHVGKLSDRRTQNIALFSGCVILWFFMAMRDLSVGVDTKHYAYVFQQFRDIPLSEVFSAVTYATESRTWSFDFEPGYRLVNKIASWFSSDAQTITIVNSTLIMVLVYRLIRKESPDFLLSLWMYLTLGIYQTEMNVTRNAIAILIAYNGFSYVRKNAFWKYCLCCLAASMFHVAALVFIPMYWVFRNVTPNLEKCVWFVGISVLVGVVFPVISPYIRMILPNSLDKYFMRGNDELASLMVGAVNVVVFAVVYRMLSVNQRKQAFQVCSIGILMLTINLCFFGLNLGLDYAARMAALFGPYVIVLIPRMINLIESPVRKRNAAFLVAVVCGCQYVLRMCVNNIGGTMPYAFFW